MLKYHRMQFTNIQKDLYSGVYGLTAVIFFLTLQLWVTFSIACPVPKKPLSINQSKLMGHRRL